MPEKEQIVLNNEQRDAAYCTENAVVAAGAGSGKTLVLASRYLWLVTEKKYHVAEILTLTFTKKAAVQMYRRIHQLLSEKAVEDKGEKGKLAKQALDDFVHARIQTLDSYSAAIVKQAANRYGISPDFGIDEDRCFRLALDESLPFVISNRNHPAMERMFRRKSPTAIAEVLFAAALFNYSHIDTEPDCKRDFSSQCAVICDKWNRQGGFIREKLDELVKVYRGNERYHQDLAPLLDQYESGLAAFPNEQELCDYFNRIVDIPYKTTVPSSLIEWAESHPLQEALSKTLNFLSSLYNLNMSKGSPRQNPAKDILWELRESFGEFSSLIVFCLQAGLIHSVLALLSDLQHRYLERKRAEGILTFSDVARLAKTILLEQHDIRQSEKESLKAIMIDEFQDNNELQKDLLYLLAEDTAKICNTVPRAEDLAQGKLFFVGDEKQSIYRFRGADVSVFRALQKELGSKDLPLATNYRSSPQLIGAFNTIFGGHSVDLKGKTAADGNKFPAVFAPNSGDLPPYEASFTHLTAHRESEGKLTLCILDRQDSEDFTEGESEQLSPVENEARYIAEKIKALLDEKKYRPDDIAILFRSRSPQHLFEKHLMLLDIPYASEDLNGFFYGGPGDDLMSVLRLAAYPTDRAAYAQMLRSPFAGLSLPGVAICLASLDDTGSVFTDKPIPLLGEGDRVQYGHGQRIYKKIIAKACTDPISSLISELWYSEGYRYETEWNLKTAAYRDLYDYLFHLASQADEENKGLASFTDYIQSLDKPGERLRDIDIPLEHSGAVHLLTIHKSKGLEFPVVFICCCDKRGKNDISDDIFDTGMTGLTLNPPLPPQLEQNKDIRRNYFWERSLAVEKGKRIAELRRLLYVGMTRAENELYLSGCLGINSDDESGNKDFSLQLKQFVAEKTEKAIEKNTIKGDTIIDGSTFFGLCLGAFAAHIPDENYDGKESFFIIEKIPAYSEQYVRDTEQRGSRFINDQQGLNSFFKTVKPFYENVTVIETPVVQRRHFSPTALPDHYYKPVLTEDFIIDSEYSGDGAADIFGKVDALLTSYAKLQGDGIEIFNSGSFGTIAHICAEALLSGSEAVIPPKLAGLLNPADAEVFLDAGRELAMRFIKSPLGIIAKKAEKRYNEFPFRSLVYENENELFISGTIDLVFEDTETIYVVDFKTDSDEFPAKHIPQMACYYRAASELFAIPAYKECKAWLYYLRSGHAVDVTVQATGDRK